MAREKYLRVYVYAENLRKIKSAKFQTFVRSFALLFLFEGFPSHHTPVRYAI